VAGADAAGERGVTGRVRANDLVMWRGSKWRVVAVKTGGGGVPAVLRLMRIVDVHPSEVTPTGETIATPRAGS